MADDHALKEARVPPGYRVKLLRMLKESESEGATGEVAGAGADIAGQPEAPLVDTPGVCLQIAKHLSELAQRQHGEAPSLAPLCGVVLAALGCALAPDNNADVAALEAKLASLVESRGGAQGDLGEAITRLVKQDCASEAASSCDQVMHHTPKRASRASPPRPISVSEAAAELTKIASMARHGRGGSGDLRWCAGSQASTAPSRSSSNGTGADSPDLLSPQETSPPQAAPA